MLPTEKTEVRSKGKTSHFYLRSTFLASFFFSIHLALLTYINSSMLRQFQNEKMVSVIFTFGSALSLILVFCMPRIVQKTGVLKSLLLTLGVSTLSLIYIGKGGGRDYLLVPLFILYFSLNSVIMYLFDLLIEHFSSSQTTGKIRGTYLSINNIGWLVGPVVAGMLSTTWNLSAVYLVAAGATVFCILTLISTKTSFPQSTYEKQYQGKTYTLIQTSPTLRRIISINFLLQFFFAWMVIYLPLYLMTNLAIGWETIGILFSIMLLPFVLFQYPVGRLADRVGEKNIIIIGIAITAIATALLGTAGNHSIVYYAIILFMTRVGASTIEVAADSYFFKQVKESDTAIISLYRTMLPIAYIIAPMAGALMLVYFSLSTLFIVLSIVLFIGILYATRLRSTPLHPRFVLLPKTNGKVSL